MDTKITTISNTDYITDSIEIINTNTLHLKDAIDALYNGLGITLTNEGKAIIGDNNYVSSINGGGINIKNDGGIQFYTKLDESEPAAIIFIDDKGKSEARFDKIKVDEFESNSSATVKQLNNLSDFQKTIVFDDAKSDYIIDINSDENQDLEFEFDGCKDGQVINVIIGVLDGRTVKSVKITDDSEFAYGYVSEDDKKTLDISDMVVEGDYANQFKFLVRKTVDETNKIILLK